MENGHSIAAPRPAWWRDKTRVVLAIALFAVVAIVAGGAYAYLHRHDTICKDRLPPKAQRDYGIGQVQYLCHDGQIVTKP